MKIIYASDDNYFTYVAVSVSTLLKSNSQNPIEICYIHQDVTEEHLSLLSEIVEKRGMEIELRQFDMPPVLEDLPAFAASKTTWAKFFFASMFPDDDRVLFLDPDTLVLDDLSELFKLDMGGNLIAGVPECLPAYHRRASKLSESDVYINGGMVLCNLAQWRAEGFENRAVDRLHETKINLNYDQGVINELCKGRVLRLDARFCVLAEMFYLKSAERLSKRFGFKQYYTQSEINEAVENPAIVHFTGFLYLKPYSKNCTHPYAPLFWREAEALALGFVANESELNKKQRLRKHVLDTFPFRCFLALEWVFDFRRSYLLTKGK